MIGGETNPEKSQRGGISVQWSSDPKKRYIDSERLTEIRIYCHLKKFCMCEKCINEKRLEII